MLMMVLGDSLNDWGMGWPGVELLAHGCRVDVRTVSRNVEVCRRAGELAVFPREGASNVYVMLLPGFERPSKKDVDEFVAMVGERGTDFLSGPTFANRNVPRTTNNDQASIEPKKLRASRQNVGGTSDAEFEEFWKLYPKRAGKKVGKAATKRYWDRYSPEERVAAMVGVRHYAQAIADGLWLSAKDPIRWVRDKAFEDWQTPAVPDNPRRNGSRPSSVNPNDSWAGAEATV